jgi:hypothetical protein
VTSLPQIYHKENHVKYQSLYLPIEIQNGAPKAVGLQG